MGVEVGERESGPRRPGMSLEDGVNQAHEIRLGAGWGGVAAAQRLELGLLFGCQQEVFQRSLAVGGGGRLKAGLPTKTRSRGTLAPGPEVAGQPAQAPASLPFELGVGSPVAPEGGADFGPQGRRQGVDLGFAALAQGQGWRSVRRTLGAVAGGFAATAAQGDEGAAEQERVGAA